ncbi:GIN domain-containing protein [Prevotella sp. HUN102]|uniref:GIN domain-containing protein n=1 Tax=Prevotella sp. HUN102 TaxID=1392486 RepID=UPI0012DFDC9F|nr:DUF2807 domain-containing protein [Prevotella sp. HUN102]
MKHILSMAFKVCLSVLISGLVFTSCLRKRADYGKTMTKEVKVSSFENIDVQGNVSIIIHQSDTFAVKITGLEKLLSRVKVAVKDNTLYVSEDEYRGLEDVKLIFTNDGVGTKIDVYMPSISGLKQYGNSDIEMSNMQSDSLMMSIMGNADIDVENLKAKYLGFAITGNASSDFEGLTVEKGVFDITGNADLDANFKDAGEVEVSLKGNSSVELTGTTRLAPRTSNNGNSSIEDNTVRTK